MRIEARLQNLQCTIDIYLRQSLSSFQRQIVGVRDGWMVMCGFLFRLGSWSVESGSVGLDEVRRGLLAELDLTSTGQ